MPVEIRELFIKGTVSGGTNPIQEKFSQRNSPLLSSEFISQLKREIKQECLDEILDKLERKNLR
jgi:hypothetical protein